jgi:hypothetical protein
MGKVKEVPNLTIEEEEKLYEVTDTMLEEVDIETSLSSFSDQIKSKEKK